MINSACKTREMDGNAKIKGTSSVKYWCFEKLATKRGLIRLVMTECYQG